MTVPTVDTSKLAKLDTLTTPRLRLVPLAPVHLEPTLRGLADPETLRLTGTPEPIPREAIERHLATVGARDDRADWAITAIDSGEYLGEVVLNELDEDNASMNFRIALAPGRTGQGFGTEATTAVLDHAFDVLGLHRVVLDVYSFNPRAERSYVKAGFVVEGRQRHTLRWDGEWVDSILMSVLSTDDRSSTR
ncbi:GCN5 family acetyltransferase [Plantibacter sp. Leaf171]|uniref:GNAT family N-acetyltransferase n=1 Tax=unclassified Plantibacter TaxID=2624265 RepID=UPI0006F317AB|nr:MULTISPECIES: GNAT family protein [unclassified Plantibacter]KQM16373.1 GCN5 family acetyltransferase [Plantibacter sp. Leaf1]KQQ52478.1 GCN5 family acetyltransferase [Plantibacter sp. Leaf314]KQR59506.1 GCN5 family acetyltransferase [Plantibacter sp. Leaf171]